jgi:hypothetical protein
MKKRLISTRLFAGEDCRLCAQLSLPALVNR